MRQGLRKVAGLAVAAFTMAVAAPAAQATTTVVCAFGSTFATGGADVTKTTGCLNKPADNDSASVLNSMVAFGSTDWVQDSKWDRTDGGSWSESPTGLLEKPTGGGAKSGDWSVSGWGGVGSAALALKGGNGFALYLIDLSDRAVTSGKWSTRALTNTITGVNHAISHISLYTAPAAIPLPAGGILLLTALGGLGGAGALRRRRG